MQMQKSRNDIAKKNFSRPSQDCLARWDDDGGMVPETEQAMDRKVRAGSRRSHICAARLPDLKRRKLAVKNEDFRLQRT